MSSAIAMRDMGGHSDHKDTGSMRHRATVHADPGTSKASLEDDIWLNTPHDEETSKLPLEACAYKSTAVYWITPHSTLTGQLTVLDLTKDMDISYTGMTNEYKAEVKKTMQDHSYTPAITCNRNGWFGLTYDVTDDQSKHIAHWSHPWSSMGEAVLTFPEDSPHATHPIGLQNKTWGLRSEAFTLNSQPYLWEMDSLWHSTNMTLYKVTGSGDAEKKTEIGKYAQKRWGGFVTGGTFVVDDEEIDGVVACLSLLVQHSRKVYSRQMMEHVVEQIDLMYWESGTREADEEMDDVTDTTDDANTVYQSDDLTEDKHIAKLPTHWDTSDEPSSSRSANITQDDYLASLSHLQDLASRRQMLQNKLNTYRTLLSLLEPYRNPKENIQPNLVWRDSSLAPELAKMRTLAIRVAGRVDERFGDIQVPATAEDEEDVDMDHLQNEGKRKVDRVLDSW
ncbi:kinetochore complex Fta4 of Sim4 subunit, or CENP-50-domain-containing protein [Phaeosphaeria sp. MPI-PUGE-AT-0046c]|nr:kinetochore complex Fta4 of Sim4 subunit, or CENP-50-domain-containing protein [Phaeosphaeria sp. MPI-PUGE-AT-0046c]